MAGARVATEDDAKVVLAGGWSLQGMGRGLFQVAISGSGFQIIIGVPPMARGGGAVEILDIKADADSDLGSIYTIGADLRRIVSDQSDLFGGVKLAPAHTGHACKDVVERVLSILSCVLDPAAGAESG